MLPKPSEEEMERNEEQGGRPSFPCLRPAPDSTIHAVTEYRSDRGDWHPLNEQGSRENMRDRTSSLCLCFRLGELEC